MDNVKIIAEFFLISLSLSYTLFSPVASSQLTGNGFIRLISNLSIGALIIALIINFTSGQSLSTPVVIVKIISVIALILVTIFHKDQKTFAMWGLMGVIVFCLSYNILVLSQFNLISSFFLLGSTVFLGIITYAMTLGHWYLVVPKLSEKPLVIAAKITWIIISLKMALSIYSLITNLSFFDENTTLGSGYAFNWMLLLMRTLFGYFVIIGMSYFNFKLVKMRSIQSSTGILYAMTFFVFIGELISSFMFFNYGLLI